MTAAHGSIVKETAVSPEGLALGDFRRRMIVTLAMLSGAGLTMSFVVLSPALPKIAAYFGGAGGGEFVAELGASTVSCGIMLGSICAGGLMERIGVWRVLAGALFGYALSGVLGYFIAQVWSFAAVRLLLGFSTACWTAGSLALLSHLYTEKGRATMIGFWAGSQGVGAVIFLLISGAVAQAFGWRASFLLYAAIGAPALLIALLAVPRRQRVAAEHAQGRGRLNVAPLLPVFALIFVLEVVLMLTSIQLPFLVASKGLSSAAGIAVVLTVGPPLNSVGSVASGLLQSRFGLTRVLLAGIALVSVGALFVGSAGNVTGVALGNGVMGIGLGLYMPVLMTLPINRAPVEHRSMVIGLAQAVVYAGAFLNPPIVAPLRKALGLGNTFLAVGAAGLVAVAISLPFLWRRMGAPKPAAAPVD